MFSTKAIAIIILVAFMQPLLLIAAHAETLEGGVQVDDEQHRIARPSTGNPGNPSNPLQGDVQQQSTRIARPPAFGGVPGSGVVDSSAFAGAPLNGNAQQSSLNSGVVQPGAFAAPPPRNFDLGSEAGSREMVLAWEKWHKQLSQAIYERWSQRADSPGQATVKVTVTRDRVIHAQILNVNGGPGFDAGLIDSIEGLNGNPGLSFPSNSQRQVVSFEADYIAGSDVRPGYSWVKNDYERVQQNY